MPELPEVETIVRDLSIFVVGRIIKSVDVREPKIFRGDVKNLKDKKVINVTRRGKIILIRLSGDKTIAIHLKMTGQLIWQSQSMKYVASSKNHGKKIKHHATYPMLHATGNEVIGGHPDSAYKSDLPHKHTHIIISFKDGSTLYFNDLRKFGWLEVLDSSDEPRLIKHLGPDPLIGIEIGYLAQKYVSRGRSPIKTVLLDQGIMSGIGNIYADETLFCAKINPTRKTGSLTKAEIEKIAVCVPKILHKSIEVGGTSRSDYVKLDGSKGGYLDIAWVYGREGKPCRVCKTPIKRIKIGQRSSHFCPNCQK